MNLDEFLQYMDSGSPVTPGCPAQMYMHTVSREALQITAEINGSYHQPRQLRQLLSLLTGRPVEDTLRLFPPLYTDCGKNLHLGKNVFINMGCKFQDQGGIYIGDDVFIGHNVVLATLNHDLAPDNRSTLHPKAVHIGNKVWIGSNATILPGVTIGDGAVVAAGAVVARDVPENVIVGGVPDKVIRKIEKEEQT